jgi:hypothetical protein
MIDYTNCIIEQIAVHNVGNKTNDEDLQLSKNLIDFSDGNLDELLLSYFLKPFPDTEYYNFTFSDDDFKLNPLFNYTKDIFEDPDCFHISSIKIAKHLYEVSNHPNIKSGDLFIAKFSNILIDNQSFETIGIFKSENQQVFLKVDRNADDFILNHEDGINIEKLDKGCLIFNTDQANGYKIAIVDKSNKSTEAQYWKELFLNLKPCSDNYHHTKDFLDIAKNYVTKQVSEEFEIGKTDKIDILNRSVDYFKSHDSFNKTEFETEVFNNEELIESFRKFDNSYRETNEMSVVEDFEISAQAVKKQARAFKSVLKLDKNFHIYIHGDKSKIESGVENDGRKFYKIYYDTEQ